MIVFPPKKILVAYDIADASHTAWRHASALAAKCGAALDVVYVVALEINDMSLPPSGLSAADVRALRAKIRAVVGPDCKITIVQGDPADRILALARLRRWDLIVVGTHARKGVMRFMLGSVAEAVVRASSVPVLIARGAVRPIRSILAPIKFTPYAEYGFAYAAAAASVLSARLTALHVTEDPIWSGDPRFWMSKLLKRLPAEVLKAARPTIKEASGGVVSGILKSKRGHDWIVLVAHGKSLIQDAFLGTTLERVLRSSSIPVLSVPVVGSMPFVMRVAGER